MKGQMKQEFTLEELRKIAVGLDSPKGGLLEARENVKNFVETSGDSPTTDCPHCGFHSLQISDDADGVHQAILCPKCLSYGYL
jgi:hypothetical protein